MFRSPERRPFLPQRAVLSKICWSLKPEIAFVGQRQRAMARTLGKIAIHAGLQAPGNAAENKSLMTRPGGLAEDLLVAIPQLPQ